MFRVSIVLSVASQQSNLWRNASGSSDQQKKFVRDFWDFLFFAKNVINVIWRPTLRRMLAEWFDFSFLCKNVAFVVECKYI